LANYTFLNKDTQEITTVSMSMSEHDQYLKDNPHLVQQFVSAPGIGDSARLGLRKPDDSFRDVLRSIKRRNPRSTVNTF
jgi:hypothetical protein